MNYGFETPICIKYNKENICQISFGANQHTTVSGETHSKNVQNVFRNSITHMTMNFDDLNHVLAVVYLSLFECICASAK